MDEAISFNRRERLRDTKPKGVFVVMLCFPIKMFLLFVFHFQRYNVCWLNFLGVLKNEVTVN